MLSPTQEKTLAAAVNRIIPPDEWPGGWEAGVGDYLYRQFERDLKDARATYQQGLDALDAEALVVFAVRFVQLDDEQQDALLYNVERGVVQTEWPFHPGGFFAMMVQHATEGFYSDPGNGGNRNQVAWEMIGFEVRG